MVVYRKVTIESESEHGGPSGKSEKYLNRLNLNLVCLLLAKHK
jgi:hypothetical protein